eukprot:19293-Prorocentrum_lima.AAC.1
MCIRDRPIAVNASSGSSNLLGSFTVARPEDSSIPCGRGAVARTSPHCTVKGQGPFCPGHGRMEVLQHVLVVNNDLCNLRD